MENQQNKIFANCSQTVRSHCEFRNVFANQFRIAKSNTPLHCSFAKFASHKTYAKFRIAKIHNEFANQIRNAKISQSQFRNANFNFAMPISNSQCQFQFRNANFKFAMPISISQCQFQIRNANFNFAMPIHCSLVSTYAKFTTHFANFANPFRIAKFTAFAKFPFAGLVILCN